jgi:hypothetical protein
MDGFMAGTANAHHILQILVVFAIVGTVVQGMNAATATILATAFGAELDEVLKVPPVAIGAHHSAF